MEIMRRNSKTSAKSIAEEIGVTTCGVEKAIRTLKEAVLIECACSGEPFHDGDVAVVISPVRPLTINERGGWFYQQQQLRAVRGFGAAAPDDVHVDGAEGDLAKSCARARDIAILPPNLMSGPQRSFAIGMARINFFL
ncbi:MAG: hypothetical protein LBJ64_04915 [Deltaproteobacteria bacterium]|nr:hypothetical protein [Deltaproteobacteria bacterium]